MNDALKIYIGVVVRIAIIALCTHFGIQEADKEKLTSPEAIALFTTALVTFAWSLYSTLKSKMNQKIALDLPKGTEQARMKEISKKQPISAVLTTEPK